MRFLAIIKATAKTEAGELPKKADFEKMGAFNEELVKAGILLSAEGLHPSVKGARLHWSGGKATVTDGPFAETKELVGGFWMIQAKSRDEAVAWMSRAPLDEGNSIEIRQIFDIEDFGEKLTPEHRQKIEGLRATVNQKT